MVIDEAGEYKPTNYLGKKVTKTDHNTIIVKMKMDTLGRSKPNPFRNYKNEKSCELEESHIQSKLQVCQNATKCYTTPRTISTNQSNWKYVASKSHCY